MISPHAIIDSKAKIGRNVKIGPFTTIEGNVSIGDDTEIGSHVVIKGDTEIGKGNRIFQFSSIGEDCQDKKYQGEDTKLIIGDENVIREACTLHRGTVQDNGITQIGHRNLLMINTHIAHDVEVGNDCIFANDTNVAGHVHIGDWAILGGATQVHQFCHIGAHSMCGVGSVVVKDIPAFVMASGYPAKPHGVNSEGMKRRDIDDESIKLIKQAYRVIYRQGLGLNEASEQLKQHEDNPYLKLVIDSLDNTNRGIIR